MLNHIEIMGRLVGNPELKTTGQGIAVCSFRIACDRDRTVEGGQKADFVDVVAWRKTAEFVSKYFTQGKPILVSGRLQIREWTDKEGKKRYNTEILADSVYFCGGEKTNNKAPVVLEELPDDGSLPFDTEDDLPL